MSAKPASALQSGALRADTQWLWGTWRRRGPTLAGGLHGGASRALNAASGVHAAQLNTLSVPRAASFAHGQRPEENSPLAGAAPLPRPTLEFYIHQSRRRPPRPPRTPPPEPCSRAGPQHRPFGSQQ